MVDKKGTSIEYDYFIKKDLSEYEGQWIAIKGKKVVDHGTLKEITENKNITNSLIAFVQRSDILYV